MKKSARVSEKLVSPGLPGLQVATRLERKKYFPPLSHVTLCNFLSNLSRNAVAIQVA